MDAKIEEFHIERHPILVVSTAHMTREDSESLDQGRVEPLSFIGNRPHGHLFDAHVEIESAEHPWLLSYALKENLKFLQAHCKNRPESKRILFILFDCDGHKVKGLNEFTW